MTRLTAADLAPKVRVNAIAVGSIATSALETVLTDDGIRHQMIAGTPLKRLGGADDPLVRQRLAWAYTHVEIMRFAGLRTLSEVIARKEPGPGASTRLHRVIRRMRPWRR